MMYHKEDFRKQQRAFCDLLSRIEPAALSQSYAGRYLSHLLQHKEYFLQIYADVLDKLLVHTAKHKEDIVLLDFGAGNGLLGLFAKYCGFKKVYINDRDEKFIESAKQLAAKLSIGPDGFIKGDESSLRSFFINDKPDAVAGTDVIEHIYDLQLFFSILKNINPRIVSVFTTASNPVNFMKLMQLRRLQCKDELLGGDPQDSVLFGESAHPSYLNMREDIIRENFLLPEEKIRPLAKATRGLIKKDILAVVHKSLETGVMPKEIAHATNTCDPLSGSWTERILTIKEYAYLYKNAGFNLDLYAGFYDVHKRLGKKAVNKIMNLCVKFFGKTFAPYIVLAGSKE